MYPVSTTIMTSDESSINKYCFSFTFCLQRNDEIQDLHAQHSRPTTDLDRRTAWGSTCVSVRLWYLRLLWRAHEGAVVVCSSSSLSMVSVYFPCMMMICVTWFVSGYDKLPTCGSVGLSFVIWWGYYEDMSRIIELRIGGNSRASRPGVHSYVVNLTWFGRWRAYSSEHERME